MVVEAAAAVALAVDGTSIPEAKEKLRLVLHFAQYLAADDTHKKLDKLVAITVAEAVSTVICTNFRKQQ